MGGSRPGGTVNNPPAMQETEVPVLGRFPRERKDYPLHYSCLENPMDSGTWDCKRVVHDLATNNNNNMLCPVCHVHQVDETATI